MTSSPSAAAAPRYRSSAMDNVFCAMIICAIIVAAYNGSMKAIADESFSAAKSAVTLAVNLIGIMALWLGLVRVLEAGGLMYALAALLRPVMRRLFPEVPPEHPAMGAMILNLAANMLGLGNAATPFGIKAMIELQRLAPVKNTATNAMCLFLAINTSGVALFPLGVIGVRAAAGASDPAAIWIPTLLATICSTVFGVTAAMLLARRRPGPEHGAASAAAEQAVDESGAVAETEPGAEYAHLRGEATAFSRLCFWLVCAALMGGLVMSFLNAPDKSQFIMQEVLSFWLMPVLMLLIVTYGLSRGIKVYEAVTEGARQGFETAVRIIPFLVAILVAIGMFRASGAMALVAAVVNPVTGLIGMPAEALPMAIIRPLSGSGAFAIMSEIINAAPDSYASFVASVLMGSTETTFYVLAIYFGSIGVVRIRHALVAGLIADVAGIIAASLLAQAFY